MILELLLDALLDSVKMLPFLFAAYWLIEYVEHRHSEGIEKALAGGGPGLQPVCIAKSKSTPPCGGVLFARCGQGTGKGRAPYNFRQLPNDTADRLWYNMSGW